VKVRIKSMSERNMPHVAFFACGKAKAILASAR
jgi:hypothetical protein